MSFDRRVDSLLVLGVLFGVALAAGGLLDEASARLPDDAVALVDGQPVLRVDYERALAALEADGLPVDDEARERALERLIEEELLVQRGLELGLGRSDRRVRVDLSAAVIALETARAEAQAGDLDDVTLRRFYDENLGYFHGAERVAVQHAFFALGPEADDAGARARADAVLARAAAPGLVLTGVGDPPAVQLPTTLISLRRLRSALGPTAGELVVRAPVGALVGPIRSGGGYHLVRVLERAAGMARPFGEVRELVVEEYVRRAGERRLRALLDARRARAEIVREGGP